MALRDFFISLSENQTLNNAAQQYGLKLGAQSVVAGTTIEEVIESIRKLNEQGISCTVDNLGEYVTDESEATKAKEEILAMIEAIQSGRTGCPHFLKAFTARVGYRHRLLL